MNASKFISLTAIAAITVSISSCVSPTKMSQPKFKTVRVATFNVSMEANNYMGLNDGEQNSDASADILAKELASGTNQQIKNIAEIIQRVNPDILMLNEFDYIPNEQQGINAFKENYLQSSQNNQPPILFPYHFVDTVNTGTPTPLYDKPDSNLRTYGFGYFAGQYGMALLSKFPVDSQHARTFQRFLWKDLPNHLMPKNENGANWYSQEEIDVMRLSSKSHWDLPMTICGTELHILASHPTPPVFDGPEDRNGRRNYDETRFWADYIRASATSYHYDDIGQRGGLKKNVSFVIVGDMNASNVEGDAYPNAIGQLLDHEKITNYPAPTSKGGQFNKEDSEYAGTHTAAWGMRADYVLPSKDLQVENSGVFWPAESSELSYLVAEREASSDHRLVWVDIKVPIQGCTGEETNK